MNNKQNKIDFLKSELFMLSWNAATARSSTYNSDFFNSKSSSNQRLFFYDKEQSKKDFEELAKSILLMYETIGSFYFSKGMNNQSIIDQIIMIR